MKLRAQLAVVAALICVAGNARAQDGHETDPAVALAAVLNAACRGNEAMFANYLTADSAAAFKALAADQRTKFLRRFSLSDEPGRPLLSTDDRNHTVFRCVAAEGTAEFRFGEARIHENLAFVPVTAVNSQDTEFGMIRESGSWRLISLGLLVIDIPQLSRQWAANDLGAREDDALTNLRQIADAVHDYRKAWGKLPESLAQLGPAPKDQVSPEQASLVNEHLAEGSALGYEFRYRVVGPAEGEASFEVTAQPEAYGKTGKRSFLLDAEGKIHAADRRGELATIEDTTIP